MPVEIHLSHLPEGWYATIWRMTPFYDRESGTYVDRMQEIGKQGPYKNKPNTATMERLSSRYCFDDLYKVIVEK